MNEASQSGEAPNLHLSTYEARAIGTGGSSVVRKSKSNLPHLFLVISLIAAGLLYFAVMTPTRFGAYHDDGIYVTTAKSLSTGDGYRIISLPYEPAQTKYPPFYPFLLSLIWRVYPEFPSNVTAMIVLSMIFTMGSLGIAWRYLIKHEYGTRWQTLIVVAMSALNWRTMILATSLYSEMPFSL